MTEPIAVDSPALQTFIRQLAIVADGIDQLTTTVSLSASTDSSDRPDSTEWSASASIAFAASAVGRVDIPSLIATEVRAISSALRGAIDQIGQSLQLLVDGDAMHAQRFGVR